MSNEKLPSTVALDLPMPGDMSFLDSMNDKIGFAQTPQERIWVPLVLRKLRDDNRLEEERTIGNLAELINKRDGIFVDHLGSNKEGNWFTLVSGTLYFELHLDKVTHRTKLSFRPNPEMPYGADYMMNLFLDRTPRYLYGIEVGSEISEKIETTASVLVDGTRGQYESPKLGTPKGIRRFWDLMQDKEKIAYIKFRSAVPEADYMFRIPNPETRMSGDTQFSFPSSVLMTEDMLEALLELHAEGVKTEGETIAFSRAFTSAINTLEENLAPSPSLLNSS